MASSAASASSSNSGPNVFINHNDLKIQKTLGSHIRRRLRDHGLEVLQLVGGDNLTCEIEGPIREASVHVVVFSPKFAESSSCLNKLMVRLELMKKPESGLTIIPVFYGVQPSELRWTEGDTGVYTKALREHGENIDDPNTIVKWRKALSEVAEKSGFLLEAYNSDEGKLVDKIVKRVLKILENRFYYDVFINHRGPDTKKTLASHLYHCLAAHGLQVFLDTEELQKGGIITYQIETAIRTASVHIAIFSAEYASSIWCLNELLLMLSSGKTIIPVFPIGVKPLDLQSARSGDGGVYTEALYNLERRSTFDLSTRENKLLYDSDTIKKWRQALSDAADHKPRFQLQDCDGDEGMLVRNVVQRVLSIIAEKYPNQNIETGDATRRKDLEGTESGHR